MLGFSQLSSLLVVIILLSVIYIPHRVHSFELAAAGSYEDNYGKNCTLKQVLKYCGEELICDSHTLKCTWCTNNTQCRQKHDTYRCFQVQETNSTEPHGICKHKKLFPGFGKWDAMSSASTFLGGILSGAGGIGGGGLFVPLLQLLGQFPPTIAIPLSKAMIFGGAILNVSVMFFQSHPEDPSRPLIDYDAALVFEPFTLIGTTVGVLCNITFPEWLTVTLLFIILGFTTIRTAQKGIKVARQELSSLRKKTSSPTESTDRINSEAEETIRILPPVEQSLKLERIVDNERKTPIAKFVMIAFCWVLILTLSLLRGGEGAPSVIKIKACSAGYWTLFAVSFPIIILLTAAIGSWALYRHREKLKLGYTFKKGDIVWTVKTVTLYPCLCFVAGILAALLGIGGGMVKGPLLLELGLDGSVAAATSSFMVFFTSSITTAQYIILGRLPWDYGLWFAGVGFLSSILGQVVIGYPARRFKITFLIIFSVTIVIGVATLLMGGAGIYNVVRDVKQGLPLGFKPPC